MMEMLLYWGTIYIIWNIGLCIIQKFDKPDWRLQRKEGWILTGCSGINAIIIAQLSYMDGMAKLLLAVLGGCLLFSCITDYKTCEVYQFIWWIAGAVGLMLLCRYIVEFDEGWSTDFTVLLFFCVLQESFFCKFYGRADCHAFVVCALAAYGMGMEPLDCVIHMLLAFGGLAIVQQLRHNVSRKGNLKRPVAFLPYITISFWINLCCVSLKKMIY